MIPLLKCEAQNDQPSQQTRFTEVQHAQPRFGFKDTLVVPNVMVREVIVEEVSDQLTKECRKKGCRVESTDLDRSKVVEGRDEDGEGGVDAYHPGERECVVDGRNPYDWLHDDFHGTHAGPKERVPMVSCPPLSDAQQPLPPLPSRRLLFHRNLSIVECLVDKEDDHNHTHAGHDGVDPECPTPDEFGDDEGCDERTEEGREDDETVPDVDRTGVLMEEVNVFDEH